MDFKTERKRYGQEGSRREREVIVWMKRTVKRLRTKQQKNRTGSKYRLQLTTEYK